MIAQVQPPAVRPLFRWAGSKRRLLPNLIKCLPVSFERYYEPFAGAACLFFYLAPRDATLGDNNAYLMETYRVIAKFPAAVHSKVASLPTTRDAYYALRSVDPAALAPVARAARFVYLNRHAFNGVYRTNRNGLFNVPCGRKPGSIPSREEFKRAAECLARANLVAADFSESLKTASTGDFVYLDPPYSPTLRPTYGEYGYGSFGSADLPRLVALVRSLDQRGCKVLLSYSSSDLSAQGLTGWSKHAINIRRQVAASVQYRTTAREWLFANYQLPPSQSGSFR